MVTSADGFQVGLNCIVGTVNCNGIIKYCDKSFGNLPLVQSVSIQLIKFINPSTLVGLLFSHYEFCSTNSSEQSWWNCRNNFKTWVTVWCCIFLLGAYNESPIQLLIFTNTNCDSCWWSCPSAIRSNFRFIAFIRGDLGWWRGQAFSCIKCDLREWRFLICHNHLLMIINLSA